MSADVLAFTPTAPKRTYGRLALDQASQTWRLTNLEPHVVLRLKNTFPKVPKTETKGFGFRHTPENCADLDWFMVRYPMAMSDADRRALKAGKHSFDTNLDAIEAILLPDWDPPAFAGFKDGLAPYDYQAAAIQVARLRSRLLLGDDLGLGKTITAMGAICDPAFLPAAIVVQPHLTMQWNNFLRKFTTLRSHVIAGTQPYSLPEADVFIFRYSNIAGWIDILAKAPFRSVIFDEIQDLRGGIRTAKGQAAAVLASGATKLRMGLSGTPVYNYGGEIFHVLELIEPGCLGTWEEFCREWCTAKGLGKYAVKDPDALGTYLREQHLLLRRVRSGRPVNTIVRQVEYDQDVAAKAEDFARALAIKVVEAPSFVARGQAARELDIYARMITGVAKARYVAGVVRILLDAGEPVLLAGWHRDCFAAGTRIMMADGSTREVEQIGVGDRVMGPNSKPRNVLSLVKGEGQLFRVVPNKGTPWVCSAGHILTLVPAEGHNRSPIQMTARQFAGLSARRQRSLTLYRSGQIDFENPTPIIEPWLLGYWLGDGASALTSLRIVSEDDEVVAEAERICSRFDLRLVSYPCKGGSVKARIMAFSATLAGKYGRNKLLTAFKALGLHNNKHIPLAARTASAQDRRELLAGLIDSDGHVYQGNGAGTAEFVNANRQLAEDVSFLARSLGFASYVYAAERLTILNSEPKTYYRTTITGDLTSLPMRIARKAGSVRAGQKNVLRTGFKLEPVADGEFYGFEVDGDHLFLLEDFTVVHNCYEIWLDELKAYRPAMYTGSESDTQKARSKLRFCEGDTNLMIISLRSGAGLDGLQHRCSTVVFGELDWSPKVHEQVIGRLDRPGQQEQVTAIYLHADDGSDPLIINMLGLKAAQARGITDPLAGIEHVYSDESRLKLLAEQYLSRGASAANPEESAG